MDGRGIGLLVIAVGIGAVILGLLIYSGALGWFGKLPGDIRVENDNVRFYFPLTSMILVSVAVTLVVNLIRRLF